MHPSNYVKNSKKKIQRKQLSRVLLPVTYPSGDGHGTQPWRPATMPPVSESVHWAGGTWTMKEAPKVRSLVTQSVDQELTALVPPGNLLES